MRFNKNQAYKDNYEVILEIFQAQKENRKPNPEILKKFRGYGGLKEVVLPIDSKESWNKTALKYYEHVSDLYKLIYTSLPKARADKMMSSIKSGILSSFYTDPKLVDPIFKVLNEFFLKDKDKVSMLDPSCGKGVFLDSAKKHFTSHDFTGVGFDLDRLAAFVAEKINPGSKIVYEGFETSDKQGFVPDNKFDIVASNIPFGDFRVFDESYARGNDFARKDSMKKIHNYFFAKGLDKTNANGILAFYTSTGVMDSPANQFLREHLMKNAQLVSAYRLPNNTFQESAGTEVTSDLIILKKREVPLQNLDKLGNEEKLFIKSSSISLENNKGERISLNFNTYFEKKPENIIGKIAVGQFHGVRDVLTVNPDKFDTIDKVAIALETRFSSDAKNFVLTNARKEKEKLGQFKSDLQSFSGLLKQNQLRIKDISDKAFVITGETYKIREFLRDTAKGKWQRKYNGWMYPKYKEDQIQSSLYDFLKAIPKEKHEVRPVEIFQHTLNFGFDDHPFTENIEKRPQGNSTEKKKEPEITKITPETANEHYLVPGNLFFYEGNIGKLDEISGEFVFKPIKLKKEEIKVAKALIDLRITYKRLYDLDFKGMVEAAEQQRKLLNFKYDSFVESHGYIENIKHRKIIDNELEMFRLYALERKENEKLVKADIFFQSTVQTKVEAKIEGLSDAILASLNQYGELNIDYVAKILNKTSVDVIKEGVDEKLIYPDPIIPKHFNGIKDEVKDGSVKYKWVTRDVFLSGNIRSKIHHVEKLKPDSLIDDGFIEKINSELESVCPPYLDIHLINPQLGERWINKEIFTEFARNVMNADAELTYTKSNDQYTVKVKEYSSENHKTYAVKSANGRTYQGQVLLSHAMNDTAPNMAYTVDDITYVDHKGMKAAEMIIDQLKKKFMPFIATKEYYVNHLEKKYNYMFNQNVKREFDGSHLRFSGLNNFEPYKHQKDCAWMIIQNNGAIADHKVGAGKTLLMAISAMEMKRLGIIKKPVIIAKKANSDAIRNDFALAYPDAKILMPSLNETSPKKKKAFFEKVMTNDWDAVVMTHDQFKTIPQSREIEIKIMEEQVRDLKNDLDVATQGRIATPKELKGLEIRIKNLEAKILERQASISKNPNLICFDKMGFDHLMVDESHVFKNLTYTTRHSRVAGLSNPEGSGHALNLLTAIRTLQNHHGGDKGVTFLSGTTISNSLVELYSLFKYLRPSKLKELQIESFDGWAKVFAEKSSDYEINQSGEIKKRERFRTFVKVPELSKLYNEIAHVVTDKNLNLDKPHINNILVNVEQTPAQEEYTRRLIEFCKNGDPCVIGRPDLDRNQLQAKMLIATNLAKKASLDMRLIDPSYEFEDAGKITKLCGNVAEKYFEFSEDKGTQLIFSDVGVPGGKDLNIYKEVKKVLVEDYGINPDEIQFIHDHDSPNKKRKLNRNVNDGKVRVVIGSTPKLGTGTNMQERIVALHHLDIPWKPDDMEQRNGRGGRQGNWLAKEKNGNKVDNFVYATNRSLDAYKFSLLAIKQAFIDKVKDSSVSNRKISEADSEGAVTFAEFMAATSGNPELLEKAKLEKKLFNLEEIADISRTQRIKDIQEREILISRVEKGKKNIEKLQKDKTALLPIFEGDKNILKINGLHCKKADQIGEAMWGAIEKIKRQQKNSFMPSEIGEIPNKLKVFYTPSSDTVSVTSEITGLSYSYSEGSLNENPAIAGQFVKRAINRIPYICTNTENRVGKMDADLKGVQKKLNEETIDHAVEINQIKDKIRALETAIELSNEIKQQKVEKIKSKTVRL